MLAVDMLGGKCADISGGPRLYLGAIVMLVGLMLTLDNFGVLDASRFWRLWPVVLIALGLVRLSNWARTGRRPGGITLVGIGLAFLLMNFGMLRFRQLFPLFLLGLGAYTVMRAVRGDRRRAETGEPGSEPGSILDAFVFMSGVKKASSSPDFRLGDITAIMGGAEIDLRQASIRGGPAVLDTFAMMGGIEVRVPDDWTVDVQGTPLMGGFEDKTRRPSDTSKRLVITGLAIMGGIEVKN
jgi:predicted membrane protein